MNGNKGWAIFNQPPQVARLPPKAWVKNNLKLGNKLPVPYVKRDKIVPKQIDVKPGSIFNFSDYKKNQATTNDKVAIEQIKQRIDNLEAERNLLCPHKVSKVKLENKNKIDHSVKTPQKAWRRVTQKYHPAKALWCSPIKHQVGTPDPQINDMIIKMLKWALNMTEVFYYDNIILLLTQRQITCGDAKPEIICNSIRQNYGNLVVNITKNWKDIILLGQGGFGKVYKVYDKSVNKHFAVKQVLYRIEISMNKSLENYIAYIEERNNLIRAYESPFIMGFITSFTVPDAAGLFLVFEFCISDLRFLIQMFNNMNSYKINYLHMWKCRETKSGIKRLKSICRDKFKERDIEDGYKDISNMLNYEIKDLMIIYTFEMFCILDYLAECNIVHRDIKPDNIMISENCHLKIGDFGLVVNNFFVTSKKNGKLISGALSLKLEHELYDESFGGTRQYLEPDTYKRIPQDFMADAFSMGLTMLEMILCGDLYFHKILEIPEVKAAHGIYTDDVSNNEYIDFLDKIMNDEILYNSYIGKGLKRVFADNSMRSLMSTISQLFLPRTQRARDYFKVKMVRKLKAEFKMAHVDVNKVKNLEPFSKMRLNPHTVLLNTIPLQGILKNPGNGKKIQTFSEVCQKPHTNDRLLPFTPGLGLNMGL